MTILNVKEWLAANAEEKKDLLEKGKKLAEIVTQEDIEANTLKFAQAIIKARYGSNLDSFEGIQRQLSASYQHDTDLYNEKILDVLDDRLDNVLKQISVAGLPLHKDKDLFDQATKLTYVIHQKGWLDLFEENFPEHKEMTDYFLMFAIRSGKAIQYIAPEYNYV